MSGIAAFIKAIVAKNHTPKPEFTGLFGGNKSANESLGVCPRCGAVVRESGKMGESPLADCIPNERVRNTPQLLFLMIQATGT
jgi:hypothetical protein